MLQFLKLSSLEHRQMWGFLLLVKSRTGKKKDIKMGLLGYTIIYHQGLAICIRLKRQLIDKVTDVLNLLNKDWNSAFDWEYSHKDFMDL